MAEAPAEAVEGVVVALRPERADGSCTSRSERSSSIPRESWMQQKCSSRALVEETEWAACTSAAHLPPGEGEKGWLVGEWEMETARDTTVGRNEIGTGKRQRWRWK